MPQGSLHWQLKATCELEEGDSEAEDIVGEAVVSLHQLRRQVPRVPFDCSASRGICEVEDQSEVGQLTVILLSDQNIV